MDLYIFGVKAVSIMRMYFPILCFLISALSFLAQAQDTQAPLPPDRPSSASGTTTANPNKGQTADGINFILLPPSRPRDIPAKQPLGSAITTKGPTTPAQNNTGGTLKLEPTGPVAAPDLPSGCFDQLKALNVIFVESQDVDGPGNCGLTDAVEVSGFDGIRLRPPGAMTCQVAISMALWMRGSVVPEARERFGQYIADINQVSTYSCRNRPSGRLSEHAFGNAIDISGFRLTDNTTLTIASDWSNGRKGRFLKAIAKSSCKYFSTVLTPLSDAAHQDHFHLDKGNWQFCGA